MGSSFLTRDGTPAPCMEAESLSPWTTREVPQSDILPQECAVAFPRGWYEHIQGETTLSTVGR